MTEAQYHWVNEIRIAHGYSPLLRRYNDKGPEHQARQIERALKVCSPVRSVRCLRDRVLVAATGGFIYGTSLDFVVSTMSATTYFHELTLPSALE